MSVCPSCGETNPPRFRFCGACGSPIEGTAAGTAAPAEERRWATVLFADLSGFTQLSEGMDPEDVRSMVDHAMSRLGDVVLRFGGSIDKVIGDALMAVFGAPVAHEDDPERAVRAALQMQRHATEDAEDFGGLSLRVGVNTGEVIFAPVGPEARRSLTVLGDVVNTASRLQQAAPVGGVVVGEATYRATTDAIDYERLNPLVVKGKADPVRAWRAAAAPQPPRAEREIDEGTPFIGRRAELAALVDAHASMSSHVALRLVTVIGEPGAGKSRLVREFRARFRGEGPRWRQGQCLPYGEGIAFWALGEIVKRHAGILESDQPEQASAKLNAAVTAVLEDPSERDWVSARLAPLVGVGERRSSVITERGESFAAWVRFLEAAASRNPLVLVIEDIHWAEAAMLEFLEYLADSSASVALLIVCTARPELFQHRPEWGRGRSNAKTVSLSPLTDDETSRLVAALLSELALPAATETTLIERAAGNPLYAVEFARMLSDRGLVQDGGRRAGNGEIPVPDTIHAVIAARLDTLPRSRRSLIQDAAVVGEVFWAGALSSIGAVDQASVEEALSELAERELVRRAPSSSVAGQAEYSFWHILVRDVAYGQMTRSVRMGKHRAVAGWIEQLAGERIADHVELLAYHYGKALELARALQAMKEAKQLEVPALRFLAMAGDRALQFDAGTAETHYQRALALAPPGHPERPRVLARIGETARVIGRFPDAERSYAGAIEEFRRQNDVLGAGEAMVGLARTLWFQGKTAEKEAVHAEALELLQREGRGPELALAYVWTASYHMLSGRSHECLEWSQKALPMVEEFGMWEEVVRARELRGIARCERGDLGGTDDMRQALREGHEHGIGEETVRVYGNLGKWVWFTEGPERGLEVYREGIELSERRGLTLPTVWHRAEALWLVYDTGRWDELLNDADEILEWERSRGGAQCGAMALPYKAAVMSWRGDISEAAGLSADFVPRAREIQDPWVLVPSLASAALIEQTKGDSGSAVALVEELDRVTRDRPVFRARHLTDAVRVATAAGRLELAERLREGAAEVAARHRNSALTARAILLEAEGDPERASHVYSEAGQLWSEYGLPLELGQAFLGHGRCLVGLGQARQAEASLTRARHVFEALGADSLGSECSAAMETSGA